MDRNSWNNSSDVYNDQGTNPAFSQYQNYGSESKRHDGTPRGYPAPQNQYPGQVSTPPQQNSWQLTAEERAVLAECRTECLLRRCIPLGIAATFGVSAGFKFGYIKPMSHPLRALTYTSAILSAFIVGRLSYVGVCKKKLLQLKNSPLADKIREMEKRLTPFSQKPPSAFSEFQRDDAQYQPQDGFSTASDFSSADQPSATNQNTSDFSKPSNVTSVYDELRMKNRYEYFIGNQQPNGMGQFPSKTATQNQQNPQENVSGPYPPNAAYPPVSATRGAAPGSYGGYEPEGGTPTEPYKPHEVPRDKWQKQNDQRSYGVRNYD